MSGSSDDYIEREHALGRTPNHPEQEYILPAPPAHGDGSGELQRHEAYRAFDRSLERLSGSGCSEVRQMAFAIIRKTLEDAGIPFLRANALAERCHAALGEIL